MKPIITTSTWKLFVALITFAAAPAFPQEEATLLLSEPRGGSLTVRKGKPSGRYAAGTQVTVRADAPPSGAHFTGWIGDVQIQADPRSAITTAIVPFTPVTITATYSADSQDPAATADAGAATARDEVAEEDNALNDRGARPGAGLRGGGHSLRAPVTDEFFYFVMADRFENGSTANDLAGLPDDPMVSGFDPTARGFYHGVVPPLSCAFHRLPGSSATRTIHRPDSTGSVQDSRLALLLGAAVGQEIR
jgi:hypothetical protein